MTIPFYERDFFCILHKKFFRLLNAISIPPEPALVLSGHLNLNRPHAGKNLHQ
jgi:hypothetical protein